MYVTYCLEWTEAGKDKWTLSPIGMNANNSSKYFESPVMSFLRRMMVDGNLDSAQAKEILTSNKNGSLPRELGYVIEASCNSAEDAKRACELYLKEAKSIRLGVYFAEKNVMFKEMLWAMVVEYALESKGGEKLGELLESAAVCGADLSKLVAKIPKGIAISGLKEKLLAAIKDYKNVLAIHSNSEKVGENDHLQLLRCKSQIIRRGVNSQLLKTGGGGGGASGGAGAGTGRYNIKTRNLFVAQSTAERNKRASNVSDIKPARMLALRMYKKRQQQAVVIR